MINKDHFLSMVSGECTPSISDIEAFTRDYPWCALGHKVLFAALCAQGEGAYLPYLPKTAAYLFNRSALYALAHAPRPAPIAVARQPESIETHDEVVPRLIVVGGDYFGKIELSAMSLEEENPIDRFIKTNPRMVLAPVSEEDERVSLLEVHDDDFMTETWAKIYADQSLYSLATEAYRKLILLYPKKSDYFAALIQELKCKTNR